MQRFDAKGRASSVDEKNALAKAMDGQDDRSVPQRERASQRRVLPTGESQEIMGRESGLQLALVCPGGWLKPLPDTRWMTPGLQL